MVLLEHHLPAREVARLLGVKTKTLASWRARGKGPGGWFHISPTLVVYSRSAVETYIAERQELERRRERRFRVVTNTEASQ